MERRISNYTKVSEHLNTLTEEKFLELMSTALPISSGTGGETLSVEVEGISVFIKKIPLTKIEQENSGSTRNLFELPTYYQYGVDSMGFGVQREIEALKMTTQWALNGECQNFPLMYHSREMKRSVLPEPLTEKELENRAAYVEYWDGSLAVASRAESVDKAPADIVVFMENLPQPLWKWLDVQLDAGNLDQEAIEKLDQELNKVTAFMRSRDFIHFDAHIGNILAVNDHVYFADFGLATSKSENFELSQEELVFFEKHKDYDRSLVAKTVAEQMIGFFAEKSFGKERGYALLKEYRLTGRVENVPTPPAISLFAEKYGLIVVLMNQFFKSLIKESKRTPYPETELSREWDRVKTIV